MTARNLPATRPSLRPGLLVRFVNPNGTVDDMLGLLTDPAPADPDGYSWPGITEVVWADGLVDLVESDALVVVGQTRRAR
jgi:hypothetical protein